MGGYYLLRGNMQWDISRDSTMGNYQKAAEYLRKSLEMDPHHMPTELTLKSVNKALSEWKR